MSPREKATAGTVPLNTRWPLRLFRRIEHYAEVNRCPKSAVLIRMVEDADSLWRREDAWQGEIRAMFLRIEEGVVSLLARDNVRMGAKPDDATRRAISSEKMRVSKTLARLAAATEAERYGGADDESDWRDAARKLAEFVLLERDHTSEAKMRAFAREVIEALDRPEVPQRVRLSA